ncbi:MAG: alanine racemase [Planctomycetota bacterium]
MDFSREIRARRAGTATPRPGAPAWIDVDLSAIAHNLQRVRARLRPEVAVFAVVKSNAYGHGLVPVAQAALAGGAAYLAVSTVDEGVQLRDAGIHAPILVLGVVVPADVADVVAHGLTATVTDPDDAASLGARAPSTAPLLAHLEVDSGLGRAGTAAAAVARCAERLRQTHGVEITGAYTHFAALRASQAPEMRRQLAAFEAAVVALRRAGLALPMRHAASSLAALNLPESHGDAVRIGGAMYGFGIDGAPPDLRPALRLATRIDQVRWLESGCGVGYGSLHVCRRRTRIAVLPLGYGSGLARDLWANADTLVRGERAPVLGLLSMNHTVIDVTNVAGVVPGDEVVLLGRQGRRAVGPERLGGAEAGYQATALLDRSLPRTFLRATRAGPRDGLPSPA